MKLCQKSPQLVAITNSLQPLKRVKINIQQEKRPQGSSEAPEKITTHAKT